MKPFVRHVRRRSRPAPAGTPEGLEGDENATGALTTLVREHGEECTLEPATPLGPNTDPRPQAAAAAPVVEQDPLAADRFTVDPEEWGEEPEASSLEPPEPQPEPRTTPWRLLVRLVLVVALSLAAFHHSVASAFSSITSGSVLVYLLAVPLYAGLASAANNRRPGYAMASGVRVPDMLLGTALCLASLGGTTLLGPGLSGVYGLWRVDLLMLWVFLLGATVLSFGLRQVLRSWPFWTVLLLLWPFPIRLANAASGGAVGGGVLLTLVVLAVVAYGHRREDRPQWQVLGAAAAMAVGLLALGDLTDQPQRMALPSAVAAILVAFWWAGRIRLAAGEPVAERRVRGTIPILVVLALLGLLVLPAAPPTLPPSAPTGITALSMGPLDVPGFVTTGTSVSARQQRYFGQSSTWQRVELAQGDPRTGPAPEGRDLVVDVLSTPRPQTLPLYPVVTTYPMGTLSSTPDAQVGLGHGVTGQLYRAEDARHDIGYTLLTFSWRLPVDMSITGGYVGPPAQLTQRITLIALDDHRAGAPFPEPGNAALDGIKAAFAHVWSHQEVRGDRDLRADERLLSDTARELVHQRLTGG